MMEWISVDDEIPARFLTDDDEYITSKMVLAWGEVEPVGDAETYSPPFVGWFWKDSLSSGFEVRGSANGTFRATHWMPLPEPPEEAT